MSKKSIIAIVLAALAAIFGLISSNYHIDIWSPDDRCAGGDMHVARDGAEICGQEGLCEYECSLDEQCCLSGQRVGCEEPGDTSGANLAKQGFCSKAEDLCRADCGAL